MKFAGENKWLGKKTEFLRTLLSQGTTIISLINLKNKSWEVPRFLKSGDVSAIGGGGSSGGLFN